MTQYTPGPWDWVIHDHSLASLGPGDNPGLGDPLVLAIGPCPACTARADPEEWRWGRCHTPSEANARLIAAAPDLLAALKYADLHLRGYGQIDPKVRAAIAKAEQT